ncbi:MAG: hypothetical protein JJ957_13780 [Pseudomonadales bacterium]|nr:hypothetical protein [Pseudomonadales bacterium]MBO6596613.1 hypothetical protein [Pseudomonadales bacterium]MBO6823398.1 hypothetical protein [Pseudomonadales bacterium]
MPINPNSVGTKSDPLITKWDSIDSMLYSLGVGAGINELQFTTENTLNVSQRVLPTFAAHIGHQCMPLNKIGDFNRAKMLHSEQGVRLYEELPVNGTIESTGTCEAIQDLGILAKVDFRSESIDKTTGRVLFETFTSILCFGEGGWGGTKKEVTKPNLPNRHADHMITYETADNQALLYRLSGDSNPLHSDPTIAIQAGFTRPILHGLCTYGFVGRCLLHTLCKSNPKHFLAMRCRFTKPVYPGDKLVTSIWEKDGEATFQTVNQEDQTVIDRGHFSFSN